VFLGQLGGQNSLFLIKPGIFFIWGFVINPANPPPVRAAKRATFQIALSLLVIL